MIVWSGCCCSGTESVTGLICSSRNRTEPDTGYSHLLACSSVTYRGRNAAHIHLPFDDVTCNIDQTLELTVMSIDCSIVTLYAKYLAKMLRMVWCRNKKMFRDQNEATMFRPGTVQVPVPVLSLIIHHDMLTLSALPQEVLDQACRTWLKIGSLGY